MAKPGRKVVTELLPKVIEANKPDLVLANAENIAHGKGFSSNTINQMKDAGVDFFTTGNHVWANSEGASRLNEEDFPVIRPANMPVECPGRGYQIIEDRNGAKLLVINLIGRAFMHGSYDCPLKKFDQIMEEVKEEDYSGVFVDFHGETTAEKYAFGFYVDGRASAVIGTHTHVATADARILERGTAFMTDIGMNGSYDSVIGVKKEIIIEGMLTQMPTRHEPEEEGALIFNSVLIEIDPLTKNSLNITHVTQLL